MSFSKQDTVSVATTSTALVPAAPNRTVLIISAPATNRFTLSLLATAVLDQGITVYPAGTVLALNLADHGDIVRRAWTAISATGAQNVTVVSVFNT